MYVVYPIVDVSVSVHCITNQPKLCGIKQKLFSLLMVLKHGSLDWAQLGHSGPGWLPSMHLSTALHLPFFMVPLVFSHPVLVSGHLFLWWSLRSKRAEVQKAF